MFKKFIPKYHYASIYDINYKKFKDLGIKTIMFDLDNTLIPYHEKLPNAKLNDLKKLLLNLELEIILVSNSKKERVSNFAFAFDIPYIKFAKKPFKKGFKQALALTSAKKEEVLFIGDQLLTDIFGSNRMGFSSLLVDPINRETEALITKINRVIEAFFRRLTIIFNPGSKNKFTLYTEDKND